MKNRFVAAVIGFLFSVSVSAANFLVTDTNYWFDLSDTTPVEISIEIKGVKKESLSRLLKLHKEIQSLPGLRMDVVQSPQGQFVQIVAPVVYHYHIRKFKSFLNDVAAIGGRHARPHFPLAVEVKNIFGQEDFLENVSGVPKESILEMDNWVRANGTDKPMVVRFRLDEMVKTNPNQYLKDLQYHGDAVLSRFRNFTYGVMPLVAPGNSIVFHPRVFNRYSILGKHNPSLVNGNIILAITNDKYVEALFWNELVPGAMPQTLLLSDILPSHFVGAHQDLSRLDVEIDLLRLKLSDRFPSGWVLKGVREANSNTRIVTDKTDLKSEMHAYFASDFDAFRKQTLVRMAGYEEDYIYQELQTHKNYLGWKISNYLLNGDLAIVQERVAIAAEFRVEVIAGQVIAGATIDRHHYFKTEILGQSIAPDTRVDIIQKIDAATQAFVDRLPPRFRQTNFAIDAALLKNGEVVFIETNPGSESGYLIDENSSVELLNQRLRTMAAEADEWMQAGYLPHEEMTYLGVAFDRWRLVDQDRRYRGYRFEQDRLLTEARPLRVDSRFFLCASALNAQ
jgi:hypothetical protein